MKFREEPNFNGIFSSVKIQVFLLLILNCTIVSAQNNPYPLFKTNDRICFVGDSITYSGDFHHNIQLFQLTRFPGENVNFYNCGIAGNSVAGVLARMDSDILINRPTHAIVMIGMNDVGRHLYGPEPTQNEGTLRSRENSINLYKLDLEKLIKLFLSNNIQLILQKPSIYDQTAIVPTPNNLGVNDALKTCADFMETMAVKYNLPIVDYWSIMNQINLEQQENDPSFTLIGNDRVHPGSTGNFVMFYQFLKSVLGSQPVAKMVISENTEVSLKLSQNCDISNVNFVPNGINFSVLEKSLPFPTTIHQQNALELVPFMAEMNQEILQVMNLKSGSYDLIIDDKLIGSFTDAQLKEGVNLALYQETPQYQQALKVRVTLSKLWGIEGKLRGLKWIECSPEFKALSNKTDLIQIKEKLDSVYKAKNSPNLNFLLSQVSEYVKNKPNETKFKTNLENLRMEAFNQAQPVVHHYRIVQK